MYALPTELYSHKSEPDNVGSVSPLYHRYRSKLLAQARGFEPLTFGFGDQGSTIELCLYLKEMPRIELGYRYSGTRGTIIYTNPPPIATSDTFPYFVVLGIH